MKLLFILPLLVLLFIPVFADDEVIQQDGCIFTSWIEKSWVLFQERPWVSGFVYNCDDGIDYYLKDFVHVRILDIDGNLVDDNYYYNKMIRKTITPEKYVFSDLVYREGSFTGNVNVEKVEVVYIKPNQYFFYMPQIHSIDFEHRGIYQIELSYGNHVNTIWFAVFDPGKFWQDP